MKDTNLPNDWRSLCELASKEKDPQKLLDLVSRISRTLEESNRPKQQEVQVRIDAAFLPIPAARNASTFTVFLGSPHSALSTSIRSSGLKTLTPPR
jgi:hypothetical protein